MCERGPLLATLVVFSAAQAAPKSGCPDEVAATGPSIAVLKGSVQDEQGRPLAHVLVSAVPHGTPVHEHPTPRAYDADEDGCLLSMLKRMRETAVSTVSDDAGHFTLALGEKGAHDVRLQGRGLVVQDVADIQVDRPLAARMSRGARVSGTLTQGAKPKADAEVFLQPVGLDDRFPYVGYRERSNAKGAYALSGLGSCEYLVSAQFHEKEGFFGADRRLVSPGTGEITLAIRVDEANDDLRAVFSEWYQKRRDAGR
jgi:hypothetical protein